MKIHDMTCPHCNAHLVVDVENKKAVCEHCGATVLLDDEVQHIQYDNAEESGYLFEKGRQRAKAEAGPTVVYTTASPAPQKKRRTWLWVLGWIFIFPLPLTILLLRNKNMKAPLKYGLIAAAWILFGIIALASSSNKNKTTTPDSSVGNVQKIVFANTKDVSVPVGDTAEGYVRVDVKKRSDFSPEAVKFESEDSGIATIAYTKSALTTNLYYEITAVAPGETYVYATAEDGSVASEKVKVIVPAPIEVESISLSGDMHDLVLGETLQLTASVSPENANSKSLVWSSGDEAVATVDQSGLVTAVGDGTVTVTVKAENGVAADCEIKVDGSKKLMTFSHTHSRADDINIGEDWSYVVEVNGSAVNNPYTLSVGDTVKLHWKFTESDDNPDIGEKTVKHTLTEEDLQNGFSGEFELKVEENGGPNSGKSAVFEIHYEFAPKS